MRVKVSVDETACHGHGRCYALAPTVFAPDDAGHAEVLAAEATGDDVELARRAEANCPEHAIDVTELS